MSRLASIFVLGWLIAAPAAECQAPAAAIAVSVRDPAAAPIAAAELRLKRGGKVVASQLTAADGGARFDALVPGEYTLSAAKEGLETVERAGLDLAAGGELAIDLTMAPRLQRNDSVDVHATVAPLEAGASTAETVTAAEAKELPSRPATVADALPLIPGVLRSPEGQLKISGSGEHRSALVVNSADVTDPATGQFGPTVPIDSVETINVYQTPFIAQYGKFSSGLVSVETKRGGDKWKYDLNDPFPDFRFRSYHLRGVRDATPRLNFSGPLIAGKLYFSEGAEYTVRKTPVFTQPFPFNEQKQQGFNSFTQIDYILSSTQLLTGTFHVAPQRQGFVNLNAFNPEAVTPNLSARTYNGTLAHRWTVKGGLLENTLSSTRFDANVWGQGSQEMILTPTGNRGSYFAQQNRGASRHEWLETYSPPPIASAGAHNLKFGSSVARTSDDGMFEARPVNVFDSANRLLQRTTFTGGSPFDRSDVEAAVFGQDHWAVNERIAFDVGLRGEAQQLTGTFRLAPRAGVAWSPIPGASTVIRAGYGLFYDRVPLNVYAFSRYPNQVVTTYAPDGSILSGPVSYENVLGRVETRFPFVAREPVSGNFAPRSSTWNIQIEHQPSSFLKLRASYLQNASSDLVILNPVPQSAALVLSGNGGARYRQFEATARVRVKDEQQVFISYVRSMARGDLNDFNNYLGSFPLPIVRPNQFSNLPADLPNRFLAWGLVKLPGAFRIAPIVEYRNGFPFIRTEANQSYAGVPYGARYPNFLSADARVSRDFKVNPKYSVRLSVSVFNLTNHFNPDSVHANLADPELGVFFGQHKRRYTADFDILF